MGQSCLTVSLSDLVRESLVQASINDWSRSPPPQGMYNWIIQNLKLRKYESGDWRMWWTVKALLKKALKLGEMIRRKHWNIGSTCWVHLQKNAYYLYKLYSFVGSVLWCVWMSDISNVKQTCFYALSKGWHYSKNRQRYNCNFSYQTVYLISHREKEIYSASQIELSKVACHGCSERQPCKQIQYTCKMSHHVFVW